jgi:HK97 family phage prohead protease
MSRHSFHNAELRTAKDNGRNVLYGYAATFGVRSKLIDGSFYEIVEPDAFDDVLARKPDVKFLQNHDINLLFGRTLSGTLRLRTDDKGLAFEVDLPDTTAGDELASRVGRDDLNECSFAFTCDNDSWSYAEPTPVRTVQSIRDLFDVSIVTYPAYGQTTAKLRKVGPEPERALQAKHKRLSLLKLAMCMGDTYIPPEPPPPPTAEEIQARRRRRLSNLMRRCHYRPQSALEKLRSELMLPCGIR